MDVPQVPPQEDGESALAAFLPVEAQAREHVARAQTAAQAALDAAKAEAKRIRDEGEAALQETLLDAEREALRDAEDKARDRVSEARRRLHAWVDAGEQQALAAVAEAVRRICGEPVEDAD